MGLLFACNADAPSHAPPPGPKPAPLDVRALDLLGDDNARRVARSPVPVLVPSERVDALTFVVESEYYAFSGDLPNGVHVAIQGTRKAHRHEGVKPTAGNKSVRGLPGFVTMNEGIRTASWIENGASYSIDLECKKLDHDACAKEEYVLALASKLAYVGGPGR
jgi:hypothetical protein